MRGFSSLFAALCCACTSVAPPPSAPPAAQRPPAADPTWVPPDAADGVTNVELAALFSEHWAYSMQQYPVWATRLGIHRYDDRLTDRSEAAIAERRASTRRFLQRAERLDAKELERRDAQMLALLREELRADVSRAVCEYETWSLSPRSNPITEWNRLHESHAVVTTEDGANLLARYRKISDVIDQDIANLRRGLSRGLVANAESTSRVVAMMKAELEKPVEQWALLEPTKKAHPEWSPEQLSVHRSGIDKVVRERIRPALARYLALLETELLPKARGKDREGLGALPVGAACYAAEARAHTTLSLSPQEIHAIGLRENQRIDEELRVLGEKVLGAKSLPAVLDKLRTDKSLYFETEQQIVDKAERALAAAKAAIPRFFGVLPKSDCVVKRIPSYEAAYTTIAYYRQPNPDGTKPGEYFVNVLDPETRPRFEAEVLAFHESIPGHHLQIAISQELDALPAVLKHGGATAFTEGWALYTERLADEMGLYGGDLDRLGMLSFDAWRASRLVVDTGIHAMGWTRQRAEDYMLAHTALTPKNISNEVDRYISWPGQALAYKLGQLEIVALRRHAEQALGPRFDLAAFHTAILAQGAVSLPVLRDSVEHFISSRRAAAR